MRAFHERHPRPSSRLLAAVLTGGLTAWAALPALGATSFSSARAAHLSGRHADAIVELRAYLGSSPRDANAWVWLGASY
ncbi:MAG: hypothetical protein ACRDF6_03090, partial [bacterium]